MVGKNRDQIFFAGDPLNGVIRRMCAVRYIVSACCVFIMLTAMMLNGQSPGKLQAAAQDKIKWVWIPDSLMMVLDPGEYFTNQYPVTKRTPPPWSQTDGSNWDAAYPASPPPDPPAPPVSSAGSNPNIITKPLGRPAGMMGMNFTQNEWIKEADVACKKFNLVFVGIDSLDGLIPATSPQEYKGCWFKCYDPAAGGIPAGTVSTVSTLSPANRKYQDHTGLNKTGPRLKTGGPSTIERLFR